MNLRKMIETAKIFKENQQLELAKEFLEMAQQYLQKMDPDGKSKMPFICCHFYNPKTGIMHCGDSDENPLFPGTIEKRKKLCKKCRDWCRKEIEKLKKEVKNICINKQ